jgi:Tfp pilus assembly protein PilN
MINLLPPSLKEQYVFGRRNVSLRRWAVALTFGLAGVVVVTVGGMLLMQKSITNYQGQVAAAQDTLKKQDLEGTRAHAKTITDSIKLATDVLSKEILFSQLLTQVAKVIPSNANLTDLNISTDQTSIEVKAVAADYASATQLQVNLQDPANKIFSKADIQTISCSGSQDSKYPCSVTLKALFSKNNPFLFINNGAAR